MSITGTCSRESLCTLRDRPPEELAELLRGQKESVIKYGAISELMAHGNLRKAAELARCLVAGDPAEVKSLQEWFGPEIRDFLLKRPLDNIPSGPGEYPSNVKADFIQ